MECACAPASLQLANTVRVLLLPCGEDVEMVCCEPGAHWKVCGAVKVFPSTTICNPAGFVATVMAAGTLKFAVTDLGAFMVTVCGVVAPLRSPVNPPNR